MHHLGTFDPERREAFARLLARYGKKLPAGMRIDDCVLGWLYVRSEEIDREWWHRFRNENVDGLGIVNEMVAASDGWRPTGWY